MNVLPALEGFQDALNEKETRFGAPTIVRLSERSARELRTIPRGSLAIFVAGRGSGVLARVARALRSRDHRAIDALVRRHAAGIVKHAFRGRTRFQAYRDVPAFGELRYATKSLSYGFFLDRDRDVAVEILPYNGGELRTPEFRFVEYVTPGASEGLECLVAIRPPVLTTLERQMLSKVPANLTEINVGQATIGYAIIAATLAVLAVAATVYVTYRVYQDMARERERQRAACADAAGGGRPIPCEPAADAELRSLNPTAAARVLLARRAALLNGH